MGLDPVTLGIGASVLGGAISSSGARSAARTQAAAADQATQLQREMYGQAVDRNAPFMGAGVESVNRLRDLLGLSDNTGAAGYGTFGRVPTAQDVMNEPGYQFGLSEGLKGVNRAYNARGLTGSGAAGKALMRYGTDYASGQYGNAFNRLMGAQQQAYSQFGNLANMGQNAANNTGQAGANFANNAASNMFGAANANAANALAQGNIFSGLANQGASMYNRYTQQQPFQGMSGQYPGWQLDAWGGRGE